LTGDAQGANAASSSAHSKLTAPRLSVPWNTTSGASELSSGGGAAAIVMSGGTVSTVQLAVAGVSSISALSAALTSKV
jgi:hypothetical protein